MHLGDDTHDGDGLTVYLKINNMSSVAILLQQEMTRCIMLKPLSKSVIKEY